MSHRIQIIVPDHTYQALAAAATVQASRPSTIAAQIVAQATDATAQTFSGERLLAELQDAAPSTRELEEPDNQPEVPAEPARAAWIEHDRGPEWRTAMWRQVVRLAASYPVLHDIASYSWATDRTTRDGVLALAVWRQQIDEHAGNDPRLELQWLAALREFAHHHRAHRQQLTSRDSVERPHDW